VAHVVKPVPYGANDFQGPKIKFLTGQNMFFLGGWGGGDWFT